MYRQLIGRLYRSPHDTHTVFVALYESTENGALVWYTTERQDEHRRIDHRHRTRSQAMRVVRRMLADYPRPMGAVPFKAAL